MEDPKRVSPTTETEDAKRLKDLRDMELPT
jgi:hypothetical protein